MRWLSLILAYIAILLWSIPRIGSLLVWLYERTTAAGWELFLISLALILFLVDLRKGVVARRKEKV